MIKSCIVPIIYLIIYRKINAIKELLSKIHVILEENEFIKLKRFAFGSTVLWLMNVFITIIVFIWLNHHSSHVVYTNEEQRRQLWKIIMIDIQEFCWQFFGFGWINVSVLFMLYICYSIHLMEMKVYKSNINMNIQLKTVKDFEKIKLNFMEIQCVKEELNNNLGLLPFLWALEMFVSTCLRITQLTLYKQLSVLLFFTTFSEYISLVTLYIFHIALISYFQSKRPSLNSVLLWIANCSHLKDRENNQELVSEKLSLVQHVISIWNESEYVAWSLFNIDRKYLIHFLSAVIPFSVMLIQLLHEYYNTKT